MLFDYLVIVVALKLASVAQKCFGVFFLEKNPVLGNYQMHPLSAIVDVALKKFRFITFSF